jgi:hypothetical protein
MLSAEEALLVAEAVREAAAAVAEYLVQEARADPRLQAALETIYGTDSGVLPSRTAGVPVARTAA